MSSLVVGLGGLGPWSVRAAEDPSSSSFPIPCETALRLGPQRLSAPYARTIGGRSEASDDAAAEHFARCRRAQIAPALAALPKDQQEALVAMDKALDDWEEGLYAVRHHGTSLSTHLTLRATVGRAEHLAQCLDALAKPPQPLQAAQQRAQVGAFRAELLRQGLRAESLKPPDPAAQATFREAMQRYLEALRALERLETSLPAQLLPRVTAFLRRRGG